MTPFVLGLCVFTACFWTTLSWLDMLSKAVSKWNWNGGVCRKCLWYRIPLTYYINTGRVLYQCKCVEHEVANTDFSLFSNYSDLKEYAAFLYAHKYVPFIFIPSTLNFENEASKRYLWATRFNAENETGSDLV